MVPWVNKVTSKWKSLLIQLHQLISNTAVCYNISLVGTGNRQEMSGAIITYSGDRTTWRNFVITSAVKNILHNGIIFEWLWMSEYGPDYGLAVASKSINHILVTPHHIYTIMGNSYWKQHCMGDMIGSMSKIQLLTSANWVRFWGIS